jgi:hypothetical protein
MTSQQAQTYAVGDKFRGAEILDIERSRIILLNNNRREYISANADEAAVALSPSEVKRFGGSGRSSTERGTGFKTLPDS